jgi:peptide chain release factor 2
VSASWGGFFDVPKLQKDLAAVEGRMAAPDFWSNRERAQADVDEVSRLRSLLTPFRELEREIEDFDALQQ